MLSVAIGKYNATTKATTERLKKIDIMANDVNLFKGNNGIELKTISAGLYENQYYGKHKKNNLNCATYLRSLTLTATTTTTATAPISQLKRPPIQSSISTTSTPSSVSPSPTASSVASVASVASLSTKVLNKSSRNTAQINNEGRQFNCNNGSDIDGDSNGYIGGGCCGILGRLLCSSQKSRAKTTSTSHDFNLLNTNAIAHCGYGINATHSTIDSTTATPTTTAATTAAVTIATAPATIATAAATVTAATPSTKSHLCLARRAPHRRTPQEVYFESRGKSCKKLLKFNGNCNKILLYPEEGWARTASSTYWTITPCWWQPNRCHIEEFSGTQKQITKAKMVALEQKGSLLIAGHFYKTKNIDLNQKDNDSEEFKLYLSSNISMEDYNMGYCLTGFVERRSQPTNAFQMTHFAVIKRQWPSINGTKTTNKQNQTQKTQKNQKNQNNQNNYNCNNFTKHMTTRRYISAALSNSCYTIKYNVDKST